MAFRTVAICNKAKLEYSLNYLVCRSDEIKRVLIDEISTLIIQNTCVSLTAALMSELVKRKVKVIFCDEKSNPLAEVIPYASSFESSSRIKNQIKWVDNVCGKVWKSIIEEKIRNQSFVLNTNMKVEKSNQLLEYSDAVEEHDTTNREGHAAKVYFNSLFGNDFIRGSDKDTRNAYLNYGYAIILSAINREIVSYGYLTQLGIHHIGETNPFNLGCDLMEPLRPLIDLIITTKDINDDNFKSELSKVLSYPCRYNKIETYIDNAIHLYVGNVLSVLNEKEKEIKFIEYGV